ncbi:AraC family transcriptional regulator [Companilactobacillus sp. HBUAS59544]|uniref:AraC family transcriptional regulator n=1 Tax=Companilactobacillus sp. HBUAS59544 TaxID=3109363 RepID=UPI002FF3D364
MKEDFNNLDTSTYNGPEISTNVPLTMFYKRKNSQKVLYTMLQNGKFHSFEAPDYQKMHRDRDFELMYVLKGQLTNYLEDQAFTFQTGEGCLLNPQVKHTEKLQDDCLVVFLNLSETLLRQLLADIELEDTVFAFLKHNLDDKNGWQRNYLKFHRLNSNSDRILKIILDSLQQEITTVKIGAKYFQSGLVLRLLAELEDQHHFQVITNLLDNSKQDFLADRVIELIDKNAGNISRRSLEEQLHYNAEYLNRLLKEKTNQTITTYSQEVRVHRAQELLTTTDLTVQNIAQKLGFSNETYFYHFFKKHVNLSPNVYRNKFTERGTSRLEP